MNDPKMQKAMDAFDELGKLNPELALSVAKNLQKKQRTGETTRVSAQRLHLEAMREKIEGGVCLDRVTAVALLDYIRSYFTSIAHEGRAAKLAELAEKSISEISVNEFLSMKDSITLIGLLEDTYKDSLSRTSEEVPLREGETPVVIGDQTIFEECPQVFFEAIKQGRPDLLNPFRASLKGNELMSPEAFCEFSDFLIGQNFVAGTPDGLRLAKQRREEIVKERHFGLMFEICDQAQRLAADRAREIARVASPAMAMLQDVMQGRRPDYVSDGQARAISPRSLGL